MSVAARTINRPSRAHRAHRGFTDEWLTPRWLLDKLGQFDFDPCCPPTMPWRTASQMTHWPANGLKSTWIGRVWLNPPYGPDSDGFMERMAAHGNGIALVFARTETRWFFDHVWSKANGLLFLRGRICFCDTNGVEATGNAGGPSVLVAYGMLNALCLNECGIDGKFIQIGGAA